jgi:hypothetical protein
MEMDAPIPIRRCNVHKCQDVATSGYKTCEPHRLKRRQFSRNRFNRRQENVDAGGCRECGAPRINSQHCRKHALRELEYRQQKKRQVMDAYGGRCVRCGTTDVDVLTLDHLNGDGAAHHRALTGTLRKITGSGKLYATLVRMNFPQDVPLQVLCFNCHFKKDLHQRRRELADGC